MKFFLLMMAALLLSGCRNVGVSPDPTTPTSTLAPTGSSTLTATLAPSFTPQPPTATHTGTSIPFQACCPLEEETFDSLPLILVNPLKIPPIGKDEGHHGLDFAYYQRGARESIQGIEIYAILSGQTVLTLENLIPYGYTILIETPLDQLPEPLQQTLLTIYQPVPENVVYQGECPPLSPPEETGEISVYHLYAHMEVLPSFRPGDPITCGQKLGTVGNTGRSSNPHLHLETRLGPSGLNLTSMAFYSPGYSEQQRAAYCLWRMSGHYQLFDPFLLFPSSESGQSQNQN